MGTSVPLKSIPFENGKGEALELCPHCHGSGNYIKRTKTIEQSGVLPVKEIKYVRQSEVNKLKKAGWFFESGRCLTCKDAGTVVVRGAL